MDRVLSSIFSYFLPGECYDKVIRDFNFLDVDCLSFALGRWLSLSILFGAVAVKLPQIIKIISSRSVEGLSYLSFLFELAAVTITAGYNFAKAFPFSTWGEAFFIAVQLFVIMNLMFVMQHDTVYLIAFNVIFTGITYCLYMGLLPMELLQTLQGSTILLVITSKLIQIVTTYQNGSTGQQAFITALLNWFGTLSRIFTTIKETMDLLILTSFIISFFLNTVIMIQFGWYWNVPGKQTKDSKKKD